MTPKKLKGIRMTPSTIRNLRKLAKNKETTESDIVRRLVALATKNPDLDY